ncbi:MAG: hypothetical protein JHC33_00180 [Ignisphaera sp.]|nr:hypothetical protein [Ignisphaera sp.]
MRVIAIALILLLIASTSSIYIHASNKPPRHVDPSTVPEQPNILGVASLLQLASMHLYSLDLGKASNVTRILVEVPIPPQLRNIINRSVELYNSLINEINASIVLVNLANRSLSINDFEGSEKFIELAETHLDNARRVLLQLQDVAAYLRGYTPSVVDKALSLAKASIDRVQELINDLRRELELRKSVSLEPVVIEAWTNTTYADYGGFIEVGGRLLDSNGHPLSNRTVIIFYNSTAHKGTVFSWYSTTDAQGFFKHVIQIKNCNLTKVIVAFTPLGIDANKYRYTEKAVNIMAICSTPRVVIHAPSTLVAGTRSSICVDSSSPIKGVVVESRMLGLKTSIAVNSTSMCIPIEIPTNVSEGLYTVTVTLTPLKAPPQTHLIKINVTKLDTSTAIDYPRHVITGFTYKLCINTSTDSIAMITASQVGFSAAIRGRGGCAPFSIPPTFIDSQLTLYVSVMPYNNSYRQSTFRISINVVNPWPTTASIALLVLVLLFVLREEGVRQRFIAPLHPRMPEHRASTLSGIVKDFVELIEALSNVAIKPWMTLREYVANALGSIPLQLRDTVLEILKLIERLLYGPPQVDIELRVREALNKVLRVVKK